MGTFGTRFSSGIGIGIGMPPTVYRRRAGYAVVIEAAADGASGQLTARLICRLRRPEPGDSVIFLGMFTHRKPEGGRCAARCWRGPAGSPFDRVPLGTWYLLAQPISLDGAGPWTDTADRPVSVTTRGPFTVWCKHSAGMQRWHA
ncbi:MULTISPECIES: hypothetical protein [unclassified Micromonospora]|uniref:hypothetical protein n=1 Tax=unclassified Micromonospora TaxID=2617518 RepID=UPI003A8B45F9